MPYDPMSHIRQRLAQARREAMERPLEDQVFDLLKTMAARFTTGAAELSAILTPFCPPGTARPSCKAVVPRYRVAACGALLDRLDTNSLRAV